MAESKDKLPGGNLWMQVDSRVQHSCVIVLLEANICWTFKTMEANLSVTYYWILML